MSTEKKLRFLDQLPRWTLVVLAFYGVMSLKNLHDQIRTDHEVVIDHHQRIHKLEEISTRLAELVEQRRGGKI
jgi:hypothetical protein